MKTFFNRLLYLIIFVIVAFWLFLYWPFWGNSAPKQQPDDKVDVLLIGGGIMSATLATYLNELEPTWRIQLLEMNKAVAQESSNAWHNAGTGHSAFAEMNYTAEDETGKMDISRAVGIAENFEISRQFWAHQIKRGTMHDPKRFINATPHVSFVWGDDNINFLTKRYNALQQSTLFQGMQYSKNPQQIAQWIPLVMNARNPQQKIAATYMPIGTDVNFGEITTQLIDSLQKQDNFSLKLQHQVTDFFQNSDGTWSVTSTNLADNSKVVTKAKFVFIGAGGAAVKLLQKSGIEEAKQYAGFPVGGEFLVTDNQSVAMQHLAKVYGLAAVGSPPMSVPHIDTRNINGKRYVLFGPFATYTTKFLISGSWFDLFSSLTPHNIFPMWRIGFENLSLVQYLMGQSILSEDEKFKQLQLYYPDAKRQDWKLIHAGKRVQVIKKAPNQPAKLQFGTEVVTSADKTIAALLGASPGASTSPPIMLKLLESAFPKAVAGKWQQQLKTIIPSYGKELNGNLALTNKIRAYTSKTLELPFINLHTLKKARPQHVAPPQNAQPLDEEKDKSNPAYQAA